MPKKIYISVKQLAEIIKVHAKTLNAWLCHYSLAKYVNTSYRLDGKAEHEFQVTKTSIRTLKKYLIKKKYKHLKLLEDAFRTKLH